MPPAVTAAAANLPRAGSAQTGAMRGVARITFISKSRAWAISASSYLAKLKRRWVPGSHCPIAHSVSDVTPTPNVAGTCLDQRRITSRIEPDGHAAARILDSQFRQFASAELDSAERVCQALAVGNAHACQMASMRVHGERSDVRAPTSRNNAASGR